MGMCIVVCGNNQDSISTMHSAATAHAAGVRLLLTSVARDVASMHRGKLPGVQTLVLRDAAARLAALTITDHMTSVLLWLTELAPLLTHR